MSKSTKSTKGKASGLNSQKRPQKARVQNNNNNGGKRHVNNSVSVATSRRMVSTEPRITYGKDSCVIVNRELVGPVVSKATTDFQLLLRLRCNPGSKATFPWLSGMASNWESYKFKKLRFIYETRSPSTREGAYIMSPDYDAADDSSGVLSEQQIFSNKGTVDDAMWKNSSLDMKVENMNRLYKSHVIMSDNRFTSTSQDEKTIDVAQVFICTDCPTASNNGKLFVEYIVELSIPQTNTEQPGNGGFLQYPVSASSTPILGVPVTNLMSTLEPLLKILPITGTGSTSLMGQFSQDFEGLINTTVYGTGIVNPPSLKVSKDSVSSYLADLSPIFTSVSNVANATASVMSSVFPLKALAGEYLKLSLNTPVSATVFNAWFAKSPLNTLI